MLPTRIYFTEMQTGLDDFRIIEDHQGIFRKILRKIEEHVLPYLTVTVDEQLGVVALRFRELGNTLVGQGIVIVADVNMLGICHIAARIKA